MLTNHEHSVSQLVPHMRQMNLLQKTFSSIDLISRHVPKEMGLVCFCLLSVSYFCLKIYIKIFLVLKIVF